MFQDERVLQRRGTFVEVMLQTGPTGDWAWMGIEEVSRDQERPPEAEAACLPGLVAARHQSLHQRHEWLGSADSGQAEVT